MRITAKIRSKDGIHVYRAELDGVPVILKEFDNIADRREISNYKLLATLSIPTLPMLYCTENSLMLPDITKCDKLRPGCAQDLEDAQTARNIARWYKALHSKGREYLATNPIDLFDETDAITLGNMSQIAAKTGTAGNPLWQNIRRQFANIRQKIDTLPRTLTYNDFYWTNLVVARNGKSAMMLDFNLMGKGYAYGDIRNVTSSMTGDAKAAFLEEYGQTEDEAAADRVISPLYALHIACEREIFPSWAQEDLSAVKNGKLLEYLTAWIGKN